mgnify:CR=1 FL=1
MVDAIFRPISGSVWPLAFLLPWSRTHVNPLFPPPVLTTYERVERQDFTSVVRPLDNGGELTGETKFAFEFPTAEKSFDSYDGINAQLR